MTTIQRSKITDEELVLNCEHSRLREALMAHSPLPPRIYRPVQALPSGGSSLSKESKLYLAVLALAGITVLCHTLVSIATF